MNNGKEESEYSQDHERSHGFHTEESHEVMGQPDGSPRFQESRAKADAYAEEKDSAPVDMRYSLFPGHDADLRHHHDHNPCYGHSRGIKGMKFLFRDPEEQEEEGNDEQFLFPQGNRSHFFQHLFQRFPAAGHFLDFRRNGMNQEEVQDHGHNGRIGSSGDEPFNPGNILAQHLLDKADGHHILGSCRLDTDIPQGVCLSHGHHQYGGKRRTLFQPEGPDNSDYDRNHAGYTGRGGWYEEGKQETYENNADDKVIGFHADMGHNHQGDSFIQPCDHHARRQEHGPCHQCPGRR